MRSESSIIMGQVGGTFGVKGWLKVNSFSRPTDKIIDYIPWQLRNTQQTFVVDLVEAKPHGKGLVVRFDGFDDRDAAQELRGMEIVVSRAHLPAPESERFYWADLEGLLVKNLAGHKLGRIEQMLDAGAADVMVIVGDQRILIPFVMHDTVVKVDLNAGCLEVDWDPDNF
jgi:16S rRNA processing protein RimM